MKNEPCDPSSKIILARNFHNRLHNYYPGNKIQESLFTQNEYINHDIASKSSPTISIFRANPYPEVTDLICRLPLPTLFYRLETLHLGDQLRISVRPVEKFA